MAAYLQIKPTLNFQSVQPICRFRILSPDTCINTLAYAQNSPFIHSFIQIKVTVTAVISSALPTR